MISERHRQQQGSVLILVAAMSMVLIAFVGLAVDGGEIEAQQRQSQNAADGAALAAATAIINADNYGYTTTDATNLAITVAAFNNIPTADLTVSFLDSAGAATTTPQLVATVKADVNHTFPTLFLPVMNIDTASVAAHAAVTITQAPSGCAICALSPTASPAVFANNGGRITATGGPLWVDSTGSPAIRVQGGGGVTATAVTSVGSVSGGTTPAALTGPLYAFTDPLLAIPTPTLGNTANDVTFGSSTVINPGTYGSITIPGGVTVTMNPGEYIIAGGLSLNGTLNGNSVMMYFTCKSGAVSATCAGPTDPGDLNINGSWTVSAPPSGSDYTGLVIYADRNDTASMNVGGTITPTGTIYAASMNIYIPSGSHQSLTSRVVVGTISVDHGGRLTVTYTSSGNYVAPGKLQMTT